MTITAILYCVIYVLVGGLATYAIQKYASEWAPWLVPIVWILVVIAIIRLLFPGILF